MFFEDLPDFWELFLVPRRLNSPGRLSRGFDWTSLNYVLELVA